MIRPTLEFIRATPRLLARWALVVGAVLLVSGPVRADEGAFITLASTTSTENSGLLDALVPEFKASTGIDVRVVAVGTGAAIRMAKAGDADVLLVHDRRSEDRFVAEGFGLERFDVMYNDFVLVGPAADPAGVKTGSNGKIKTALARIAVAKAPFISRGDDSGTHKAELRMWKLSGVDPANASGTWYRETGSGMGAALNTADAMGAYTLVDRGTWLSFRNRSNLEIVFQGDPPLHNPYGVILVNPARHAHVKAKAGQLFVSWLTGPRGQAAIGGFRVDGEVLFTPSAHN